jgi:hypothetical protein
MICHKYQTEWHLLTTEVAGYFFAGIREIYDRGLLPILNKKVADLRMQSPKRTIAPAQAGAVPGDSNMAFTCGRSKTMKVNTPSAVPNGTHMQLRPAITRQNT